MLEDGVEGAFLEVEAVDDDDVGVRDVADVAGGGTERVGVRAGGDHCDHVGVVAAYLLGEVGKDAGGRDDVQRFALGGCGIVVVAAGEHGAGDERHGQERDRCARAAVESA